MRSDPWRDIDMDVLDAAMRMLYGPFGPMTPIGPLDAAMLIEWVTLHCGPYEGWPSIYKNPPK